MREWMTMAKLVRRLGVGAVTSYLEVTRVLWRERVWRM